MTVLAMKKQILKKMALWVLMSLKECMMNKQIISFS